MTILRAATVAFSPSTPTKKEKTNKQTRKYFLKTITNKADRPNLIKKKIFFF